MRKQQEPAGRFGRVTDIPPALGGICDDTQLKINEQEKTLAHGSLSDGEDMPGAAALDRETLVHSLKQFSTALRPRLPQPGVDRDEEGFTMVLSRKTRKRRAYVPLSRQILTRQASRAIQVPHHPLINA